MGLGRGGELGEERDSKKRDCRGEQSPYLGVELYPKHDQEPCKGF